MTGMMVLFNGTDSFGLHGEQVQERNDVQLERNSDRGTTKLGRSDGSLDLIANFLSFQYAIVVG